MVNNGFLGYYLKKKIKFNFLLKIHARCSEGPVSFFWWIIGERGLTFYGKYKKFEKKVQGGRGVFNVYSFAYLK